MKGMAKFIIDWRLTVYFIITDQIVNKQQKWFKKNLGKRHQILSGGKLPFHKRSMVINVSNNNNNNNISVTMKRQIRAKVLTRMFLWRSIRKRLRKIKC